jgi:hypothetical protein
MANNTVSVDTVYQKVLALANKEQRGYITPQEFNLFASQAQLEIFENYFHDLKTAQLKPKNHTDTGDEIEMLSERMSVHRVVDAADYSANSNLYTLSNNAYSLSSVKLGNVEADRVEQRDLMLMLGNPLTNPTTTRPVYTRTGANKIIVYPTGSGVVKIEYIEKPTDPKWTYVVISGKALYNSNASDAADFDLHESEENNLVMRILELSGITLADPNLVQLAMRDKANTKAEKNN